jgi:hypothetical protein
MAMILILPDRDMGRELFSATFRLKGIRPVFRTLTILLFPVKYICGSSNFPTFRIQSVSI